MYCPKCAAQNLDEAQFCRACGANISLVPQALTGRLPKNPTIVDAAVSLNESWSKHKKEKEEKEKPSLEKSIANIFMGIGFVLVALAIWAWMPGGFVWWFWMLIPAFALIGGGVGQLVRLKYEHRLKPQEATMMAPPAPTAVPPTLRFSEIPSRDTSEFLPPPTSVTEATTRHLGAELVNRNEPQRHRDTE